MRTATLTLIDPDNLADRIEKTPEVVVASLERLAARAVIWQLESGDATHYGCLRDNANLVGEAIADDLNEGKTV